MSCFVQSRYLKFTVNPEKYFTEIFCAPAISIAKLHATELLRSLLDRRGVRYRMRGEGIEIPLKRTMDALAILELCRGRFRDFEVLRGNMDNAYLKVIEQE